MPKIAVIISTYNPNIVRLSQTLRGLKRQTLPYRDWELIIIDNNSNSSFIQYLEVDWHPNVKIVKEPRPGLTYGRLKGFTESTSEFIVMVDDDNILSENYLTETLKIFEQNSSLGSIGGKSMPLFEITPPIWIAQFYRCLAIRDLGDKVIEEKWDRKFPVAAPIGAGMAIRRIALRTYIEKIQSGYNVITDRQGKNLGSGGDNDIILEILKSDWIVAYYPSLKLEHIIPAERLKVKYLARLNKDSTKSWIQLLNIHGISPWSKIPKLTLRLRKIKAWFIFQPLKNESNYIKYKGICGMYEALSEL